ncbi:MAG TPA: TPM domain-containing protein, partial [Polyangiaceae bacterium]|nr:TPM domain-containing protein [Polyangiaceae bacterium]
MTSVRALFVFSLVLFALVLGVGCKAPAHRLPPLQGHVMDTAGKLSPEDIAHFNAKLDAFRERTGYAIVVFVTGSLEGENVEDFSYEAASAWRVGDKGSDNGVLLLIAPNERKVRIEVGKGGSGALTDLTANDIIRNKIGPALRERGFRQAIEDGTDAIMASLSGSSETDPSGRPRPHKVIRTTSGGLGWLLLVPLALPLIILALIWSAIARARRRG